MKFKYKNTPHGGKVTSITLNLKDIDGTQIKTKNIVEFVDENGKLVRSKIYPTRIGWAVKRGVRFYSNLEYIVDTFEVKIIE